MKKKLQVFISSTYNDLIEERQAAVEAILNAGHIPAGMELFSAGNETQLETVKRWIDESDVYLLILGGRYGSVEPKTGKSYTQLEYEYALDKGMPLFSIIISDSALDKKVKEDGQRVIERDNNNKYKEFKDVVVGKICRFFDDVKDIKISIHETLSDFEKRFEFTGWVSGKDIPDFEKILVENSKLLKENAKLKNELEKIKLKNKNEDMAQSEIVDLINILESQIVKIPAKSIGEKEDIELNLLQIFLTAKEKFAIGVTNRHNASAFESFLFFRIAPLLLIHNLLEKVKVAGVAYQRIQISKFGYHFLSFLDKQKYLPQKDTGKVVGDSCGES